MEEMTLEDFFKESEKNENKEIKSPKNKRVKEKKSHLNFKDFFKARFSFDLVTDLTDQTSVLYRRNVVIKNIISVTNILFIIFSLVGVSKSNLIVTIAFMLMVTGLSYAIKKMLSIKENDYDHQVLVMYLQSIFIFVKAVVLYIKVYLGFVDISKEDYMSESEFSITQAAYFLMFYSVVVVSLYQDTKLLKNSYIWTGIVISVINITLLHPELYKNASSIQELYEFIFNGDNRVGIDIILRTFVMIIFFVGLYVSTLIFNQTSNKRTLEIKKRVGVENTFKEVLNSLFDAVKAYSLDMNNVEMKQYSYRVTSVSQELAKAFNLDSYSKTELKEMSEINIELFNELNLDNINEIDESNFDEINKKTLLSKNLLNRLKISKSCDEIVKRVLEATIDQRFIDSVKPKRLDIKSNILMISEIYVILRSDKSYKRSLTHQRALEVIVENMKDIFMEDVILRFRKFNTEINKAYDIC